MQKQRREPGDIHTMKCSKCNRPFEISVTANEAGELETYLQCWHCFISIPVQMHPQPEFETSA
jgi:DNA-directed RNA polymerase subunit RPC12/RpoP